MSEEMERGERTEGRWRWNQQVLLVGKVRGGGEAGCTHPEGNTILSS